MPQRLRAQPFNIKTLKRKIFELQHGKNQNLKSNLHEAFWVHPKAKPWTVSYHCGDMWRFQLSLKILISHSFLAINLGNTYDIQVVFSSCNSPSPPLTDIVRFGPLCIIISLTVLKHVFQSYTTEPVLIQILSSLGFPFWASSQGFWASPDGSPHYTSPRKRFPYPYKKCFVPRFTHVGSNPLA